MGRFIGMPLYSQAATPPCQLHVPRLFWLKL
jgi:hypothetical protein